MKLYVSKRVISIPSSDSWYNVIKHKRTLNYTYKYYVNSTMYSKPYTLFTYTHRNSNIPMSLKTGTIRGELIRRVKICSTYKEYIKHKRIYFNRLKRWGYSNKFLRVHVKHPNYNLRNNWINKSTNNNKKKNSRKLFMIKLFDQTLDNHSFLKYLIKTHLFDANMLKDHKIIICNKTGNNIGKIINYSYISN